MRGLTASEVAARAERGQSNSIKQTTSRPLAHIIRDNVFTLFNGVLTASFVLVVVLGDLRDGFFFGIVVINALIGIVQELRAKIALDRLAVLTSPPVAVRRDDETVILSPSELVIDDVVVLRPGDQLVADATVISSIELYLDESLLTGEADPVLKREGESLLSGSLVVVGTGQARVTAVGHDSYVSKLTAQMRRHSLAHSELRAATNRILVFISWILGPIVLLILGTRSIIYGGTFNPAAMLINDRWRRALIDVVASVVGMIPEGLVLLTSLAFGVAAIQLARRRVLVQELAAVEILARVDVLCLDKTGTLTSGIIEFRQEVSLDEGDEWRCALGHFALDDAANATARALHPRFSAEGSIALNRLPFSSHRAYGGVLIERNRERSSWLLGAPERLFAHHQTALTAAAEHASAGFRTLALTRVESLDGDPATGTPAAILLFGETIRPDAAETLRYFEKQGVRVIVLSGDNHRTVAAVTGSLGIGDSSIDARTLTDDAAMSEALTRSSVFGRVTPEQKRSMVHILQSEGHTVAMTGDGVNDAMAIKDADLGIAMGSGTSATKAVARVVLLDNRFDHLPDVVAYGRRVIANVERVANLYLAKTAYGILFAIGFSLLLWQFPFYPRQLTLISTLTIGIPSFFLALAPNRRRYHPGILRRLVRNSAPTGAVAAVATGVSYSIMRTWLPLPEARSVTTLTLFVVSFWILCVLSRPLNLWRVTLLGVILLLLAGALVVPVVTNLFAMQLPSTPPILMGIAIGAVGAAGVETVYRISKRRGMIFDRQ